MHLDFERMQRLLDDELTAAEQRAARAHLDACADCRSRAMEAARDTAELDEALRLLDHPPPAVSVSTIARAAGGGRRVRGLRWAATIALVAGLGGAAYAAPGSPLPAWFAGLIRHLDSEPDHPPPARGAGPAEVSGIAVPAGSRLIVSFVRAQQGGVAVVTLAPAVAEVTLRAPAGAATFVAGPESLIVENADSIADYAIEIPADAPVVEIRVAGKPVFRKEGARVTAPDTPLAPSGPYRLPLHP